MKRKIQKGVIERYDAALKDLYKITNSSFYQKVGVREFTKKHGVSGSIVNAAEKLGYVQRKGHRYKWLLSNEPERKLAFHLLAKASDLARVSDKKPNLKMQTELPNKHELSETGVKLPNMISADHVKDPTQVYNKEGKSVGIKGKSGCQRGNGRIVITEKERKAVEGLIKDNVRLQQEKELRLSEPKKRTKLKIFGLPIFEYEKA